MQFESLVRYHMPIRRFFQTSMNVRPTMAAVHNDASTLSEVTAVNVTTVTVLTALTCTRVSVNARSSVTAKVGFEVSKCIGLYPQC